jgi:DNA-binding transcriptional MerR regulator
MNKSPEAFRTISEVADALDVPPHVLRFWESRFIQVKPVKRGGGRRYYRPEDVRLLRGIRGLLYDDGMTIKGVQKILRERGVRHVIGIGTLPEGEPAPQAETPSPASARKPAARKAPAAAPPASQDDLFAAAALGAEAVLAVKARPAAGDRAALRALVAELVALRAAMAADDALGDPT